MSLPALFRHRDRFIGCLAIGRVPRRRVRERVRVGRHEAVLDAADIAAFDSIAETLLYRAGDTFSIVTQGYDYPSLARCPALADDGRCAIHLNGKPLTCEVVPLDPLVPDRLQYLVLAGRNQSASYIGADCIQEGERPDASIMVAHGQIEDANVRDAVASRRRELEREREVWGRAVFEALRKDLFESPSALTRIPPNGFLTISIVPALLAVAGISAHCRQLCLDYIDSQLALIERSIEQALLRRRLEDRPVTQELRGFAQAHQRAKTLLATPLPANGPARGAPSSISTLEAYLSGTSH